MSDQPGGRASGARGFAPMPPPPPGDGYALRPAAVTAASVLWVVLGVFLALAYGYWTAVSLAVGNDLAALFAACLAAVAVGISRLGQGLRHGRDERRVLTVIGILTCLSLVPLVLVVPAIVLQYRPSSRHWFSLPQAAA